MAEDEGKQLSQAVAQPGWETALNWMDRDDLQSLLESAGFAVKDGETNDELRKSVAEAVRQGDIELEIFEEGGDGA